MNILTKIKTIYHTILRCTSHDWICIWINVNNPPIEGDKIIVGNVEAVFKKRKNERTRKTNNKPSKKRMAGKKD